MWVWTHWNKNSSEIFDIVDPDIINGLFQLVSLERGYVLELLTCVNQKDVSVMDYPTVQTTWMNTTAVSVTWINEFSDWYIKVEKVVKHLETV